LTERRTRLNLTLGEKIWSDTNRSITRPDKKRRKRNGFGFQAKSKMTPTCNELRE
jgi:hypothetical protein